MRAMKYFKLVAVAVTFSLAIFLATPEKAQAQAWLGGFIFGTVPCTCVPGLHAIYVGPPFGGVFTYYTGTQAYLSFNLPTPGHWILGQYIPGGPQCLIGVEPFCAVIPSQGILTPTVGTSL